MDGFDSGQYVAWREQRLRALDVHLGPDWVKDAGRILELGAASGQLTHDLTLRGARSIVAVEARPDYASRIARPDSVEVIVHNLDKGLPEVHGIDTIIHFGVLYHLGDARGSIKDCAGILLPSTGMLILESEVLDSSNAGDSVTWEENPDKFDDGVGPWGQRLSYGAVEACLDEHFDSWERVEVPDHPDSLHSYTWPLGETMSVRAHQRKMWVAYR